MKSPARIPVRLGTRSYEIVVQAGGLRSLPASIESLERRPSYIALVTDNHVDEHYGELVLRLLREKNFETSKIVVLSGEPSKSVEGLSEIYRGFARAKLDRQALVIALGGGVVGDLAGFAAATYLRGIDWFHVPTSLLAQVDASVGGKTGINLPWGKNLAGSFHQPKGVLIDPEALDTLPEEEFRNGMAEVIKIAAVVDEDFFAFLEKNRAAIFDLESAALHRTLCEAVSLKAKIVSEDERESGKRMLLNFGHTLGHSLESAEGFEGLRHGEAVSIGMAGAANLCAEEKICPAEDRDRLLLLLRDCSLPTRWPDQVDIEIALQALTYDKKRDKGKLRMVLMEKIGRGFVASGIEENALRKAISLLR